MSQEDPFCVSDYSIAGYDFDSGFDYDPSALSFPFDHSSGFADLVQEQEEDDQNHSAPATAQDDDQISGTFSSFPNKAGWSNADDNADSNSSGTVSNFGYSPHDSSSQSNCLYGDIPSLDDLDLSTPIIPSTPNSHYAADEVPKDQDQVNFKCPKCSKTFETKSKFTAHRKYHDRSFQCPIPKCTQSFGVKEQLKRHLKEVHEKRRILCPVRDCKKEYSRVGSVRRHLANKHSALDADKLLRHIKQHQHD